MTLKHWRENASFGCSPQKPQWGDTAHHRYSEEMETTQCRRRCVPHSHPTRRKRAPLSYQGSASRGRRQSPRSLAPPGLSRSGSLMTGLMSSMSGALSVGMP
uniref:Uncharacterized protein n=1 Tax=Mus musculus TaxID=10090 RepID=Q9D3X4_MOUSE|nr:unnamed protein product [Mus musculus]|eukprot:NP_001276047.1 uncharacterized protein LOC100141474 [Mus musculus]